MANESELYHNPCGGDFVDLKSDIESTGSLSDYCYRTETSDSEDSEDDSEKVEPNWSDTNLGQQELKFSKENKLLVSVPGNGEPIDWFFLLLDDDFLNFICEETNRFMCDNKADEQSTSKPSSQTHNDITIQEIKLFLGLLLRTGFIRNENLKGYWDNKDDILFNGVKSFEQYMNKDRFLHIYKCLHFSKVIQTTELEYKDYYYKINDLINYFNKKMKSIYYPKRELIIDESVILWKGCVHFKDYMKCRNHGFHIFSVNEPTGLTIKLKVHANAIDDIKNKNLPSNVVLFLLEDLLHCGHSIHLNDFFNSFSLAKNLLAKQTYCTGFLKKNKKYNPIVVKKKKLKSGETVAQYSEGIMIAKWKESVSGMYISTEFKNEMGIVSNKKGQTKEVPIPILNYTSHMEMEGVDREEQMFSLYPCHIIPLCWYKKIFVHVLQLLMINSFHLYNKYKSEEKKRYKFYNFQLNIIETLISSNDDLDSSSECNNCTSRKRKFNADCSEKGSSSKSDDSWEEDGSGSSYEIPFIEDDFSSDDLCVEVGSSSDSSKEDNS